MTRKIRTYTEEFKQECVTLALKSESISQTAKDLGIPEGQGNCMKSERSVSFVGTVSFHTKSSV